MRRRQTEGSYVLFGCNWTAVVLLYLFAGRQAVAPSEGFVAENQLELLSQAFAVALLE